MSTRCQIRLEGSPLMVYVHQDGYPAGILPTLMPFVSNFHKFCGGDDLSFMLARLTQVMANMVDARMNEIWDSMDRGLAPTADAKAHRAGVMLDGVGVDAEIHGDTAYLYDVKKDGSIDVLQPRNGQASRRCCSLEPGLSVELALKLFAPR